jgi:hypothetical protein
MHAVIMYGVAESHFHEELGEPAIRTTRIPIGCLDMWRAINKDRQKKHIVDNSIYLYI